MMPWLLDVLACPRCESPALRNAAEAALVCDACSASYPLRQGVPDFVQADSSSADFEAQWTLRLDGKFERPERLYGNELTQLTRWLADNCLGTPASGDIIVDAGCGSGEKAAVLARLYPQSRVLGLDLSPTIFRSAQRFAEVPNLAFARMDLLHSALRKDAIPCALSWGVLHHTASTERAMALLARAVRPGGRLVIWLYPHPDEAPVWRPYYWLRDIVHLGRGHKLPPAVRLWLCRLECALMAPALWAFYVGLVRPFASPAPFMSLGAMSLGELYDTAVFMLYDALSPRYHDRPHSSTIRSWFARDGFGKVQSDGFGHYWATRAP